MKGILQKDENDGGVLHAKLRLQTDSKAKCIHEDGVVNKLEFQCETGRMQ